VPLWVFMVVSFTMIVQLPMPDSPLTDVSLKGQRKRNRKERRGEKELTSEVRS
jgi:hypothetical protein